MEMQVTGPDSSSDSASICVIDGRLLKELSVRPSVGSYVKQLIGRRFFIIAQAKAQANDRSKQYRLWRLWLVANPLLDVLLFVFLFGVVLKASRGIENYPGYVIIGVVFMRMITGMVNRGSLLIRQSKNIIKAFDFPRASVVLAQAVRHLIENFIPACIAVFLSLALQFPAIHWTVVFAIPLYLLIHVFGSGLMLLTSRVTTTIPDLNAIVQVLTQAWFFLSGVMYTVDRFDDSPTIKTLMEWNPGYVFLTALRECVLYGEVPGGATWITLAVWSLGTFVLGFLVFWQFEDKYIRYV